MKKLGAKNYYLISTGVQCTGTFNPDEIFYFFEEMLLESEVQEIYNFLKWVHDNGKGFGSGNYENVFKEFKQAQVQVA